MIRNLKEEEIDSLPEEMGLVLMAEAQRAMAGAEPLHEQLGITPEAARKRRLSGPPGPRGGCGPIDVLSDDVQGSIP